jgi:hypothetical protein
VRDAARTVLREATRRRAGAILAAAKLRGEVNAHRVPLRIAAEGVLGANEFAAFRVVAPRREVRFAATLGTLVTALEEAAAGPIELIGCPDAEFIPQNLAAE